MAESARMKQGKRFEEDGVECGGGELAMEIE
jgi:hypothetical protein